MPLLVWIWILSIFSQKSPLAACVTKREAPKLNTDHFKTLDVFHVHLIKSKILTALNLPAEPIDSNEWMDAFKKRNASSIVPDPNLETPLKQFDLTLVGKLLQEHRQRHRKVQKRASTCQLKYLFHPHLSSGTDTRDVIMNAQLSIEHNLWEQVTDVRLISSNREQKFTPVEANNASQEAVFNLEPFLQSLRDAQTEDPRFTLSLTLPKGFCMRKWPSPMLSMRVEERRHRSGHSKRQSGGDVVVDCERQWDEAMLNGTSLELYEDLLPCCRRRIRINFRDLGWHNWVVAPAEFDSFYCLGRCSRYGHFAHQRGQGEAVYADLMNQVKDMGLTPCCSPVRFVPLTVTALIGRYEEVTQTLQDLIVSHCGCM